MIQLLWWHSQRRLSGRRCSFQWHRGVLAEECPTSGRRSTLTFVSPLLSFLFVRYSRCNTTSSLGSCLKFLTNFFWRVLFCCWGCTTSSESESPSSAAQNEHHLLWVQFQVIFAKENSLLSVSALFVTSCNKHSYSHLAGERWRGEGSARQLFGHLTDRCSPQSRRHRHYYL